MESKDTNTTFFEYDNEILYVKTKVGFIIEKSDMEQILKDAIEITGGNKYYALIDTTNQTDSTPEARNYYSNSEYSRYRFADAYVVNSLALRLVVNFYLKFSSPPVPSKMFGSIKEALQWIEELKVQNKISFL